MIRPAPHIVFAGGGTCGHLFPGLAVAEQLAKDLPATRITFAGTGRDFERQHVRQAGFDYLAVPCRPFPRNAMQVPRFLADHLAGYWTARRFLRRARVDRVVGLGGYASVPMARAAVSLGIPLVLLEQNAVPGRATRWLAASASLVCIALDAARNHFPPGCRVRVTGNPVRSGFMSSQAAAEDGCRSRQILILGGSNGAHSLNETVPRVLAQIGPSLRGWRILHQSGATDRETTRQLYANLGLEADVVPFVADMPAVLARTDLAVARAGGTTLAELSVAGIPAVLLPYPDAADDHQRKNADVIAGTGGCVVVDEREPAGSFADRLVHVLDDLLRDENHRLSMSRAIREIARPDAARHVARRILALPQCCRKRKRCQEPFATFRGLPRGRMVLWRPSRLTIRSVQRSSPNG
jgi:UDP-N-acetylglucosamine--N-acetylmuramyl-(pentapeptide) pyrophosphoryl-undecaprenol N-acetylglucosamine transferase